MSSSDDLANVLLARAREDELAARSLAGLDGIADAIIGFHCQQAAEKALKAVLAARGVDFPYSHDLDGLIELAIGGGATVPSALEGVEALSPFGVQLRYDTGGGGQLDRDQAVAWASTAIEWASTVVERI